MKRRRRARRSDPKRGLPPQSQLTFKIQAAS